VRDRLHEMADNFDTLEAGERTAILIDACTIIEEKLADSDYLKLFTHRGKQAFYDDHPDAKFSHAGYHLSDNFYVFIDQTETKFILGNHKEVYGKNGHPINLFDQLMWPGWGRYSAPTRMNVTSQELKKYYGRTKQMAKNYFKIGGPLVNLDDSRLMSFYYRYAGKSFYNMKDREGIDNGLHTKFRAYITKAIELGLKEAIERHMGPENTEILGG
jgi:hypothetical protein